MQYEIINAPQGSEAWLEARKDCFTASEAPIAKGKSKYQTRDELLAQKKTGLVKEVDANTQKLFNRGHETEALARVIAEEIIGDELYPITAKRIVDGLPLLASMDGLTMDGKIGFEHKLVSQDLIEQISNRNLEEHYTIQMDQQIVVTGCEKILFMASDGTKENCHWLWYESNMVAEDNLIAGWHQFAKDLENFVPPQKTVKVEAEAVKALPVPSIVAQGALVASNLNEVIPYFDNYLSSVKTELTSDEDFANGEVNAKHCRDSAKSLKNVAKAVIGQIVEINDAVSLLEQYAAKFDAMGLRLEKAVKEQKEQIKANAIMLAKSEYEKHVTELEKSTAPLRNKLAYPNFAEAIKGVKTIDSMRSRLNDAVARGKTEATTLANEVIGKLLYIEEAIKSYEHLFNVNELAFKDIEFIKLHIQTTKDAEDKRRNELAEAAKQKAIQEAETKPVERVVEPNKTILPPAVEQEFGKQFVEGLDDVPTPNDIINTIGGAYKVNPATARQYIVNAYEFISKKAA